MAVRVMVGFGIGFGGFVCVWNVHLVFRLQSSPLPRPRQPAILLPEIPAEAT